MRRLIMELLNKRKYYNINTNIYLWVRMMFACVRACVHMHMLTAYYIPLKSLNKDHTITDELGLE